MKKFILSFSFSLLYCVSSFSQEAQKLDEFGYLNCGYFMALVDSVYEAYNRSPNSRLYVIYYEEKGNSINTKKYPRPQNTTQINPRKGDALSKAREIGIYLKSGRNLPADKIIYADGGYRENFALEIYLLPEGAVPPKSTPTIAEKDVVFRKGKPRISRDCSKAYDMYS